MNLPRPFRLTLVAAAAAILAPAFAAPQAPPAPAITAAGRTTPQPLELEATRLAELRLAAATWTEIRLPEPQAIEEIDLDSAAVAATYDPATGTLRLRPRTAEADALLGISTGGRRFKVRLLAAAPGGETPGRVFAASMPPPAPPQAPAAPVPALRPDAIDTVRLLGSLARARRSDDSSGQSHGWTIVRPPPASARSGAVEATLREVAHLAAEDTLVFRVEVRNLGRLPIGRTSRLVHVSLGGRTLPATARMHLPPFLPPGGTGEVHLFSQGYGLDPQSPWVIRAASP